MKPKFNLEKWIKNNSYFFTRFRWLFFTGWHHLSRLRDVLSLSLRRNVMRMKVIGPFKNLLNIGNFDLKKAQILQISKDFLSGDPVKKFDYLESVESCDIKGTSPISKAKIKSKLECRKLAWKMSSTPVTCYMQWRFQICEF